MKEAPEEKCEVCGWELANFGCWNSTCKKNRFYILERG